MSRWQRSVLQLASGVLLFIVYLVSTPTPLPPRTALLSYPEQPAALAHQGRIREHNSFSTQRAREFDEIPQQDNGEVDVDVSNAPMQEQVSNMDITVAVQRPHSHRLAAVAAGGSLTGHHALVDGVSASWAREPARASVLAQLPGRTQQFSAAFVGAQGIKKREGRMTELHILTAHERGEFREMREGAHMKRVAAQVGRLSALRARRSRAAASSAGHLQSAAGQQLAHWPYEHSSAVMGKGESLDTLGRAIDDSAPEERQLIKHYILDEFQHKPGTPMLDDRRADFSEANPPCYTAEDCHRFVVQQPGSHLQKESDLPVYDNDMLELVSFVKCGAPAPAYCSHCQAPMTSKRCVRTVCTVSSDVTEIAHTHTPLRTNARSPDFGNAETGQDDIGS
jgi:hypothetical protein